MDKTYAPETALQYALATSFAMCVCVWGGGQYRAPVVHCPQQHKRKESAIKSTIGSTSTSEIFRNSALQ